MDNQPIHTDSQLLEQIAAGDQAAFHALFERYRDRFYAVALKMTRSATDAEEIVQEVFIQVWLKRKLLADVRNPRTYLFTIVYNRLYDLFERLAAERLLKRSVLDQGEEAEDPFESFLLEKEGRYELLERAIAQLPAQQQRVYRLSKQEGLSREAVAERTGLSPNTVKNHLQQATKALHTYLQRALPLLLFILFKNNP